jgi:hypothetical protein
MIGLDGCQHPRLCLVRWNDPPVRTPTGGFLSHLADVPERPCSQRIGSMVGSAAHSPLKPPDGLRSPAARRSRPTPAPAGLLIRAPQPLHRELDLAAG